MTEYTANEQAYLLSRAILTDGKGPFKTWDDMDIRLADAIKRGVVLTEPYVHANPATQTREP